ncbi:hypothetical protein [Microbacterium sp. NPDC056569]|uniref:hypothetical protein n=1 Tax=Microbacterium sp. NPDC056569 TaxID=3345867 RepID=UPI00366D1EAE
MTTTAYLDRGDGNLSPYEAESVTDRLSAHGVWWERLQGAPVGTRPVYVPSSGGNSPKDAYTEQLVEEETYGEGARRDLLGG